jgi:hypothetical protein
LPFSKASHKKESHAAAAWLSFFRQASVPLAASIASKIAFLSLFAARRTNYSITATASIRTPNTIKASL